ncbi:hypothetical protein PR202_gb05718 [Eleusine coracana subsp. coracana]|uniref:Wall-associated receptor kinase galacturonan-binding domain-containing protein n=1 Tax=Eleusine coracana subsp. coracana TaxID=191504 RepID=A0AAV5E7N1_ELECO|nr:hypothetical protein PR202_gb05718 [Eleusine coracana subsp. coracana]
MEEEVPGVTRDRSEEALASRAAGRRRRRQRRKEAPEERGAGSTIAAQNAQKEVDQVLTAAVHVADAEGPDPCPPFSCGNLHNVSSPFRRPGDPPECGVKAYELLCSSGKATIRINTGTYSVTNINYTEKSFWVVDANLDTHCPVPRADQLPYGSYSDFGAPYHSELATATYYWACFVNCSQAVTNISWYKPVTCLSTNSSFVYLSISFMGCHVSDSQPFCGYLATIPISLWPAENASSAEIIELVKKGFSVSFPTHDIDSSLTSNLKSCLIDTNR